MHFLEDIKNQITEFLLSRLELTRILVFEKIAKILSALFTGIILAVIFLFAILFSSLFAGIYFSQLFQNPLYGFGIVAAFYVLMILIVFVFRKQLLEKFFFNTLIQLFNEKN